MSRSRPVIFWISLGILILSAIVLLRQILLPFVAAFVVAYLLNPLANKLERLGMNRLVAALLIIGGLAVGFIAVLFLTTPIIARDLADVLDNLPALGAPDHGFRPAVAA
jgi:predicted PurR-regulated permease PerM